MDFLYLSGWAVKPPSTQMYAVLSECDFHQAIKMTVDRSTDNDRLGIYYEYMIDKEWYNLGQAFDISVRLILFVMSQAE